MNDHLHLETLVTYRQVATRLMRGCSEPLHVSTLHRWAKRGLSGVRLEAIKVGGRWYTSVEALQRFFFALASLGWPTDDSGSKGAA